MRDNLISKSSQWAQRAIKSYLDTEHELFFVQAGVSFELLGKAFLAGIHPSLIVDKDFDSLLQVCGAGTHSKRPPGNIRTIGARDVVARVSQVLPQLKSYEQQLGLLADLRNGAVHLGVTGSTTFTDAIGPFLQATQTLLESCGQPFDTYFGAYTEIARKLLDESSQEIERRVAVKLARAREAYKEKFGELETKTVQQISGVIFKTYDFYKYQDEPEDCPACSELGVSSGDYEVEWEYADWDDPTPEPKVTLFVNHFLCKVCGLTLEGREEIKAAGLREKMEIEDVDAADFFEPDYEPDK